eukprot:gnl/TRDRNA2_/TRDRNA2_145335_c0_seq1.p1 gnl/TRDRNA2_/TRDRNA2_145335_c0~~gnl/TRDRNA2_/TRDRNA2_145335_c0_seq1.p1  ORF type:complete len:245 (+),score=43.13 gnl/TRDRNA2_/TRDRNA2_145335_c0_seq1:95-829(+)
MYGAPGGKDYLRSVDEIRIIQEMTAEEVEAFVSQNNIDVNAARELRSEPPHVALAVIDRGPLTKSTNPSASLVGRIRDTKRSLFQNGKGGGVPMPAAPLDPGHASELENFLAQNNIDHGARSALAAEKPEIQKMVMGKGNFTKSTNPSASLMARIRHVKNPDYRPDAGKGGGPLQPGPQGMPPPGFPGMAPPPPPAFPGPGTAPQLSLPSSEQGAVSGDMDSQAASAIQKLQASLGQNDNNMMI